MPSWLWLQNPAALARHVLQASGFGFREPVTLFSGGMWSQKSQRVPFAVCVFPSSLRWE